MEKFESYYHYIHNNDYSFNGHSHSMWEINIILSGALEVVYDDQIINLKENTIILYEPKVFHRNRVVSIGKINQIVYHFLLIILKLQENREFTNWAIMKNIL